MTNNRVIEIGIIVSFFILLIVLIIGASLMEYGRNKTSAIVEVTDCTRMSDNGQCERWESYEVIYGEVN